MTEYGQQSQFRDTAGLDAVKARELAGRLELRAKSPAEVEARQAYLDLLSVQAGECVLDVGCGSGAVTRDIARRVGPAGRAVGVDPSPQFLVVARELAAAAGLGSGLEFCEGSVLHLPFPRSLSRCSRTLRGARAPWPRWRAWCALVGAWGSSTSTPT